MERTIEVVIFTAFAIVAFGLVLSLIMGWGPRFLDVADTCSQDPYCEEYGTTLCVEEGLVTCKLDENGCLVASIDACECETAQDGAHCP